MRSFSLPTSFAYCVLLGAAPIFGQGQQSAPVPPQASSAQSAPTQSGPSPAATAQPTTKGGDISGTVKSGNTPLPGVSITATNTLTGQKALTSTDYTGRFALTVPSNGRWVIRAELPAFAPTTKEALINAASPAAKIDLEMMLQSRAQAAAQQQAQQQQAAMPQFGGGNGASRGAQGGMQTLQGRGIQSMDLSASEGAGLASDQASVGNMNGAPEPGMQGVQMGAASESGESVAVSGAMGRTENFGNPEDFQERMEEMRERMRQTGQNFDVQSSGGRTMIFMGSPGGPGGGGMMAGGPMGGGPFQLRLNRANINKPHGSIFYNLGDSAFDARPYALNSSSNAKPSYAQHRYGFTIGGPLTIPKLLKPSMATMFFVNYFGTRASNPYDVLSTVPTLAERNGDFSQAMTSSGAPVQIFDPVTHQPFANNIIPADRINSAAAGLLAFVPTPNLPGTFQNFRFTTSNDNTGDNLNLRLIHNFGGITPGRGRGRRGGPVNNLNFGVNWRRTNTDLTNPFPAISGGSTSAQGINVPIGYSRSFGHLNNSIRFDYNRQRIQTTNLFGGVTNVAGSLGINGVSQNPFDWGMPNISLTNFAGMRDTTPLLRRDQTVSIGDGAVWSHGKHSVRFGADFRRVQQNPRTDSNARGSFVFTGFATAATVNGVPVQGTGFDLADLLLGLPQQASVQYGVNGYYFRQNSWDVYAQDEWRVRGNLTINAGLRYEYVSPFSEKYNRIVNLDAAPGFTAVAPVQPGETGPFTGTFTDSLMNPDRNNFAPRVGVAWKPFKNTVVRSGYSINYNTGAYSTIVSQFAYQPPFATTETNTATLQNLLSLQNAFAAAVAGTITNNFGADRTYVLPYVQNWNLDIQHQLTRSLILNVTYNGAKGTHLDMVRAPNRDPLGLRIANVQPFLWQTSQGDSILHSGSVRLRKRMQHGVSFGGTYIYSKSIDNASSIGGGATVVAQNDQDLAAERGLSSFDQRHRFTADYVIELPFGTGKRWLTGSGAVPKIFGDWQISGDATIASGTPFTARVLGNFADVSRGTNGTLRADVTGQPIALSDPTIAEWFNTAAFVVPPIGQFGDAGRNTIIGPGTVTFDMSLNKNIPIKEMQAFEIRATATNVFNTPQFTVIDTVVNSPTFGRVTSVGTMRRIQLALRYRF